MNNPSVIPAFDFRQMVTVSSGELVTTSVRVAEYFGKKHKNVLQAIRNLQCSDDFKRLNFKPTDFIDKNGDVQPMMNITRDGCMFLIMGFTGYAAAAIKESYIAAFNWMAEQLSRRNAMGEELQHRYAIKETRSKLKGTIGSRLMNERKKEKRVLAIEHEQIMAITQPQLIQ
ncbi:Rha family transcriptional regulator [Mixta calida]|uniref:Rha family transcriptional regulator n=1 Tax=Mixta calida TaxID=665913 RepID=UPI0029123DA2|nr:Rha family transcriptional regulator [Mixta calida]MDU6539144.1 Rha family transcriptional regulator [Mixta calida]